MAGKAFGKLKTNKPTITGTDGDDSIDATEELGPIKINGGDGDDDILGSDAADRVNAGDGDDRVRGGLGDDILFGNGGTDTAVFSGSILDYVWAWTKGNTLEVTGADGFDQLKHFEYLEFDDFTFNLAGGNAPIAILRDMTETGENTAFTFRVDLYDFDGDDITVDAVNTTGGSVSFVADGTATQAAAMGNSEGLQVTFDPGSDYDYLAEGETTTETVTVTFSDGTGNVVTASYEITITGTNDAPTLAVGTLPGTDEDGAAVTLDLATLGDDVDSDDDGTTLSYAITGDPSEGSASITGTTLSFDPGSDFQDLAVGETRAVSIALQATDRHGASSPVQIITVTVTGTNDAPTLAVAPSGSVTEDENVIGDVVSATGAVSIADADLSDTHTIATAYNGDAQWTGGTLSAAQIQAVAENANFSATASGWSYSVSNAALQFLGSDETITLSFTVTATDDSGAANDSDSEIVAITIYGQDDGPEIIGAPSLLITDEDQNPFSVDLGQFVVGPDGIDTDLASLVITADGAPIAPDSVDYETGIFTVDPRQFNFLSAGEEVTLRFDATFEDENGATVQFDGTFATVQGLDDPYTVTLTAWPEFDETDPTTTLSLASALSVSDPDTNDTLSSWLTNAVVYRADSDYIPDTFEGRYEGITFSGSNVIVDPSVFQDKLSRGEQAIVQIQYGIYSSSQGYSYGLIPIIINGVNAAPEVSGAPELVVTDEDQAPFTVDLGQFITDPDGDDTDLTSLVITADGQPVAPSSVNYEDGTFTIDPGVFNSLSAGEEVSLSFEATFADGFGGEVQFDGTFATIMGVDDPYTATLTAWPEFDETDPTTTLSLASALSVSDPDTNDTLSTWLTNAVVYRADSDYIPDTFEGRYEGITFSGSNVIVDPSVFQDKLSRGEQAIVQIQYGINSSAQGISYGLIPIVINGVNAAPEVSGAPELVVTDEDQGPFTVDLGQFITDPDGDDTDLTSLVITADGQPVAPSSVNYEDGTFTIDPGVFNSLSAGEEVSLSFEATFADGFGGEVQFDGTFATIMGADDPYTATLTAWPEISANDPLTTLSLASILTVTDPDANDVILTGFTSAVSVDPDSDWTSTDGITVYISPDIVTVDPSKFAGLNSGEQAIFQVQYAINSSTEGITWGWAPIIINGNTTPEVVGSVSLLVTDEDQAPFTVDLNQYVNDPDGDDLTLTGLVVTANGVEITPTSVDYGAGTFTVDPNTFNGLGGGQDITLHFGATFSDGFGGIVQFEGDFATIEGVNDPIQVTTSAWPELMENDPLTTFALADILTITDPDGGDTVDRVWFTNGGGYVPGYALDVNFRDGITFAPNNTVIVDPTVYQELTGGEQTIIRLQYGIYAGGNTTYGYANIVINGVNEGPDTQADFASVTENALLTNSIVSMDLLANDSDPDGDPLSVTSATIVGATPVTLSALTAGGPARDFVTADGIAFSAVLDTNGEISFDVDASTAQQLSGSDIADIEFWYAVTDGSAWTTQYGNTLSIEGLGAVAGTNTPTVKEDSVLSGQIAASDTDDPAGSTLSYRALSAPDNGTLAFNANGSYTYTPDPDYFGPDSFDFEVSNGEDATTGTVDITVEQVLDDWIQGSVDFAPETQEQTSDGQAFYFDFDLPASQALSTVFVTSGVINLSITADLDAGTGANPAAGQQFPEYERADLYLEGSYLGSLDLSTADVAVQDPTYDDIYTLEGQFEFDSSNAALESFRWDGKLSLSVLLHSSVDLLDTPGVTEGVTVQTSIVYEDVF